MLEEERRGTESVKRYAVGAIVRIFVNLHSRNGWW